MTPLAKTTKPLPKRLSARIMAGKPACFTLGNRPRTVRNSCHTAHGFAFGLCLSADFEKESHYVG